MLTILVHSLWASVIVFLLGKSDISTDSLHGIPEGGMISQANLNWPDEARSQQQITYLDAKEFQFEAWIEELAQSPSKGAGVKEVVRHDSNGSFDMMLIPQEGGLKVVMQITQNLGEACIAQPGRACQQGAAAPARGNVVELQWSLPTRHLKPGTYHLGKGGSTPQAEVITFWQRIASDLPGSHPDCQRWGEATLRIQRADVNGKGTLEFLEGAFTRICEQSLGESAETRVEQSSHRPTPSSGAFILHANWWGRLSESPR